MKADKAIRLVKTIDPINVLHGDLPESVPTFVDLEGYNNGWTMDSATTTATSSFAIMSWSDTIDIAGLAANDISLVNQGGAVARPSSPYSSIDSAGAVSQLTLVSTNPIEVTGAELGIANALHVEGNLQDYFLATNQEFVKSTDDIYLYQKAGEHNFGTGGIAQATKLYVKSFVWSYQARPIGIASSVIVPPVTVAIGAVTAELDQVQMAAAIYRANDQE